MQLSRSVPSRVGPPATRSRALSRGTLSLVAISLATLAASAWLGAMYLVATDPCALPAGASSLDQRAQAELARHAMLCRDLEAGRITLGDYRTLIGADAPTPAPAASTVQWASSVRAVSSEYSDTAWSAKQALGAPDVYPRSGDDSHAWASRDPDAPWEFIEVGFATPRRIRGLEVYETLNPGAITEVEIVTASGARTIVYEQQGVDASALGTAPTNDAPSPGVDAAGGGAQISTFEFACSDEPVVAARVTLASGQVAGWNEIDAIGALPCR